MTPAFSTILSSSCLVRNEKSPFRVLMYSSNYNMRFLVFAKTVVRESRVPFEISSHEADITREWVMQTVMALRVKAKDNGVVDVSLDCITIII